MTRQYAVTLKGIEDLDFKANNGSKFHACVISFTDGFIDEEVIGIYKPAISFHSFHVQLAQWLAIFF